MTSRSAEAEGWYRDPYGIHQDRWFSAGNPTAPVRDHGVEGHDEPPGSPPPGPPAEIPETDPFTTDDLRRADEQEDTGGEYAQERAVDQASDASATGFAGFEGFDRG